MRRRQLPPRLMQQTTSGPELGSAVSGPLQGLVAPDPAAIWGPRRTNAVEVWPIGTGYELAIFRWVGFKAHFGVKVLRTVSPWSVWSISQGWNQPSVRTSENDMGMIWGNGP